jgi:hypothetical protein
MGYPISLRDSADKLASVPYVTDRSVSRFLLFLSALIRVYSLELSFGSVGSDASCRALDGRIIPTVAATQSFWW